MSVVQSLKKPPTIIKKYIKDAFEKHATYIQNYEESSVAFDLSCSNKKNTSVSKYLAHLLFVHIERFHKRVLVVYKTIVKVNSPHTVRMILRGRHDELDTNSFAFYCTIYLIH